MLGDEAGLVLCTWPHGGRPRFPFVYSDEVWTGIEYQVAAQLIYEVVAEGLNVVAGRAGVTTASGATPGTRWSAAITTPAAWRAGRCCWP